MRITAGVHRGRTLAAPEGKDTRPTSDRAREAAAVIYAYCVEQYGGFPATIPAVAPGVWVQAHHLETEFYDHYYGAGAYPESVATHQERWHSA